MVSNLGNIDMIIIAIKKKEWCGVNSLKWVVHKFKTVSNGRKLPIKNKF